MATAKKKGEGDWLSWGLIAVLFLFGIWPIGLILLLVKLFGGDGKRPCPETARRSSPAGPRRRPGG